MTDNSEDTGVILALMKRFNEQRLPRMLELKKRVEQGGKLSDNDIAFLEEISKNASHAIPLIDRHPELETVATRAVSLYKEITDRALENEKNS